jgi:hypothetical protein
MRATVSTEPSDETPAPRRAVATGKVIRADTYGHVDLTAIPRADSLEVSVEAEHYASAKGIPSAQQDAIIAAVRRVLDAALASGSLRCGVRVIIESGSCHEQSVPAHAEAAELAIRDALRRGKFTRKA